MKLKQLRSLHEDLNIAIGRLKDASPNKLVAIALTSGIEELINKNGFNLSLIENGTEVDPIIDVQVSIDVLLLLKEAYINSKGKGSHSPLTLFGGGSAFKKVITTIAEKYFSSPQDKTSDNHNTLQFLRKKIEELKLQDKSELEKKNSYYEKSLLKQQEIKFLKKVKTKGWAALAEEGWITEPILNAEHNAGQPLYLLPAELMLYILLFLNPKTIVLAGQACKYLYEVSVSEDVWRIEMARHFPNKIKQIGEGETYRGAFSRALRPSSYILHRCTRENTFSPLYYFNHQLSPYYAVAASREIFENLEDIEQFLRAKRRNGVLYIVEVSLPKNKVEELQKEKQYDALVKQVRKIHPDAAERFHFKATAICVEYDTSTKGFVELKPEVEEENMASKTALAI